MLSVDASNNRLTAELPNGREITYNPEKTRGLTATSTVFHQSVSEFAEGDRIRFTGSDKDLGVRRGEFGTIERIGEAQDLIVRTDAGKRVEIAPSTPRQFEQGYVVSDLKGMSPDRVLVSEAYQAVSRVSEDAAIYTPHPEKLYEHLQREPQGEKNEQSNQANKAGRALLPKRRVNGLRTMRQPQSGREDPANSAFQAACSIARRRSLSTRNRQEVACPAICTK